MKTNKKNQMWNNGRNYKRASLYLMMPFLFLLSSCESFVEVDLPHSELPGSSVFEDYVTAEAALMGIYAQMRSNSFLAGNETGISYLLGLYSDELELYNRAREDDQLFFNNNLMATQPGIINLWNNSYNLIYSANSIIEGVENSSNLSELERKELKGEALFIRAFIHFHLLNMFGDIPFIDSTDYRANSKVNRLPEGEVYQLIISDLVMAKELLPETYSSSERVRPNKWVSSALLSRVHLYDENWQKAVEEASLVIEEEGLYQLNENPEDIFLKDSKSTIWQFNPNSEGVNSLEAKMFIFFTGPPPGSALTDDLINSFEEGDLRSEQWIGEVSNEVESWFYPFKYKENSNTPSSVEYSIVLRLAEQFLIRSEALAHLGKIPQAKDDLDRVRSRAGLAPVEAATEEELLRAIARERRTEFFAEFGHRFFDLKRTGFLNEELQNTKPGWDPTDQLLPLPDSELNANPNLKPQNPGY